MDSCLASYGIGLLICGQVLKTQKAFKKNQMKPGAQMNGRD